MAEIILPGTYITVRDEGLITAGQVATGIMGIVGTAAKGPVNSVNILGSLSEARELFGDSDQWIDGTKNELTLIRALEQIYNNGGSAVCAVRTAHGNGVKSAYQTVNSDGTKQLTKLEASSPGTWGDEIEITINDSSDNALVQEELKGDSTKLNRTNVVPDSLLNSLKVKQFTSGLTTIYQIIYKDKVDDTKPQVLVNPSNGNLTFSKNFQPLSVDTIYVQYEVPSANSIQVAINYQGSKESYIIADAQHLTEQVNNRSSFITATSDPSVCLNSLPRKTSVKQRFGSSSTDGHTPGANGEAATAEDYKTSLAFLEADIINIVLLAGQDASNSGMVTALMGHINTTSERKRERIALIGCSKNNNSNVNSIINEFPTASDRLIFVGPGLKLSDSSTLPGSYTAAAVAGLISTLPVQASPTNKIVTIEGLNTLFNSADLEKLVQKNILVLEKRDGWRIVKGVTTSSNSAWTQITTRRIVDYAIYGVRSACNPYIGKLNNDRVRGAMKATLDAFLTRMVNDEALIGYTLAVTATRAQEIAGEVMVTMIIQPTFSIDFIKVTMYLG